MILSKRELERLIRIALASSQTLVLSGQKINPNDLETILKLMAKLERKLNKKIESLNLNYNFLSNEGCLLLKDKAFTELYLDNNEIEDEGAYYLSLNPHIIHLSLLRNYILTKMRGRITQLMQERRNQSLQLDQPQNSNLSIVPANPDNVMVVGPSFGDLPTFVPFSFYNRKLKINQTIRPANILGFFFTVFFYVAGVIFLDVARICRETLNLNTNSTSLFNGTNSFNGTNLYTNSTSLFNSTNHFNGTNDQASTLNCDTDELMSTFGKVCFFFLLADLAILRYIRNIKKDTFSCIINKEDCNREGTNLDPEFIETEKLSLDTLLRLPDDQFEMDVPDNIPQRNCLAFLWDCKRSKPKNFQNPANPGNAPLLQSHRSPLEIDFSNTERKVSARGRNE